MKGLRRGSWANRSQAHDGRCIRWREVAVPFVAVLALLGLLIPPGSATLGVSSSASPSVGARASESVAPTGLTVGGVHWSARASAFPSLSGAVWTNITAQSNGEPEPRAYAAMAYDATDGYVVLFGGMVYSQYHSNAQDVTCTSSTWIFQSGKWTNLSIEGPPANCFPTMTYDAADGYVVMTGGWNFTTPCATDAICEADYDQTWIFTHGKWNQLSTPSPPNPDFSEASNNGAMTYDPTLGEIVLCTVGWNATAGDWSAELWGFSDGVWSELSSPNFQVDRWTSATAYDAAAGGILAIYDGAPLSGGQTQAWLLRDGSWTQEASVPAWPIQGESLAYDPVLNVTVCFGATVPEVSTPPDFQNVTWLFADDQWVNASIGGPSVLWGSSMVFDAHDGYVVMYGGRGYPRPVNEYGEDLSGETWIYAPPPADLHLKVSTTPPLICSEATRDCGAGTTETRVTVSVTAIGAGPNVTTGVDSGSGGVSWGPYYWTDDPTLRLAGWNNVVPETGLALDGKANCTLAGGGTVTCPGTPTVQSEPGGNSLLRWSWGEPGTNNTLQIGDTWTVSFNAVALGPPFGPDPVDSCTTAVCNATGVTALAGGVMSGVVFSPYGNSTVAAVSAPLGTVTVLASPAPSGTVPSSAPPASPPPIGAPLPVGAPAAPVTVPSPVGNAVATGLGATAGSLSLAGIAGGLVGAGVARGAIRSSPQRVAQKLEVGRGGARPPRTSRGVD